MQFTLGVAMIPLDELPELARTAEACGFSSIALPDSLFYPEKVSADYPYTADGARMWNAETPWADPLIAAAVMAGATTHLRFYTQVLKLGSRNPVLLARQIGSVANMTGNRFGLGVGLGWAPEEFIWCGAPFENRGARADEMIEILRLVLAGGMVEFHGDHFDFDRLQMSPAPTEQVPIYVGGHTTPALRRAARLGDGWTSAMMTHAELAQVIPRLTELRSEYGRTEAPFEIQAFCTDKFGLDGYQQLADIGVTDTIVVPWPLYGLGFDAPLDDKKDALEQFARDIISHH